MRLLPAILSALALLAAHPAHAQRSNHSITLESGLSAPAGGGGATLVPVALSAAAWLEGAFQGTARLAWAFAPRTGGRGADAIFAGTLGLRYAPGASALRPELLLELGWARAEEGGRPKDGVALGLGGGAEWFPARDLSLATRAVLRRGATSWRLELGLAATAYF